MGRVPPQSWAERLRRSLQSLRDTAPRRSRSERALQEWCSDCRDDELLLIADRAAGREHRLPHWLVHSLRDALLDIRVALIGQLMDRPLGSGAVGDHLLDATGRDSSPRTPEQCEALRLLDEHSSLVELWLQTEMRDAGPWLNRILAAGRRLPSGTHISPVYLERLVLSDPSASWIGLLRTLPPMSAPDRRALAHGRLRLGPEDVPDWLGADDRLLVEQCLEWDIQRRMRVRRRQLEKALGRIADPEERSEELMVADAECVQYGIELRESLLQQLSGSRSDLGLVLAAAAHAASCGTGG